MAIPLERGEYYLKICPKCRASFGCKATCRNEKLVHRSFHCKCLNCEPMKLICKRIQFEFNPSYRKDLGKDATVKMNPDGSSRLILKCHEPYQQCQRCLRRHCDERRFPPDEDICH